MRLWTRFAQRLRQNDIVAVIASGFDKLSTKRSSLLYVLSIPPCPAFDSVTIDRTCGYFQDTTLFNWQSMTINVVVQFRFRDSHR